MKLFVIIAVLGIFGMFGAAMKVSACSCSLPIGKSLKQQVKAGMKGNQAIFVGKIVEVRFSENKVGDKPVTRYAKFQVDRSWRGPRTEYIVVATANICCICGIDFEVGSSYIVYANSDRNGGFSTNSCSRTSPVGTKSDDEKYLGKVRLPKKTPKS